VDEKQFTRLEAIINSMTKKEREQPRDHLRQRGASGSRRVGNEVQEVNKLLRQYAQMSKMFKQMGKGGVWAVSSVTRSDNLSGYRFALSDS
jgi:signal recognition particle subunit SRP54